MLNQSLCNRCSTVCGGNSGKWERKAQDLKNAAPEDILKWGKEEFGNGMALACSFGYEDVALVHLVHQVAPETAIFYLDTDLLFPETYRTRDRLVERYGVKLIRVTPEMTLKEQAEACGERLWENDPDRCCRLRKVEPLRKILSTYSAWCTGIRREQSPTRADTQVLEWDRSFGLVKINPFAFWKESQVWNFLRENDIPYNPMHDHRYPSIGCQPCTRPVQPGEDARAGRWTGHMKTECGLHLIKVSHSQSV